MEVLILYEYKGDSHIKYQTTNSYSLDLGVERADEEMKAEWL